MTHVWFIYLSCKCYCQSPHYYIRLPLVHNTANAKQPRLASVMLDKLVILRSSHVTSSTNYAILDPWCCRLLDDESR